MTLNFIIKVSHVARRSFGTKLKPSFTKSFQTPMRNVLPCVSVNNAERIARQELRIRSQIYQIHLSSPKRAVPPLVVVVVRYVAKIGAVVSGRLIRKWWSKLSPEEKEVVLEQIRSRKSRIALVATVFVCALYLYYLEHIVEDPITKRKRFIMLNTAQINQIAEFEYQRQMNSFRSEIVPKWHPLHRRVSRVANTLIFSNGDLKEIREKVWSVTVVDRPDITNAFALPHGKIFVFTGMLNICTNDDQLAIVLAHEISHSILSHVAESMSKIFFLEFLLLIPSIIFWSVFSDAWALFSEWITNSLAKVLIHLPFSRSIEREADVVGLELAAKSCYDVREAPVFWGKMKIVGADEPVEWLSTHPRHETRQSELKELVPKALAVREKYKCPPLGAKLSFW